MEENHNDEKGSDGYVRSYLNIFCLQVFSQMSTVILACSALTPYVRAAQKKVKTNYPIVEMDRKYHDRPQKLKLMLEKTLKKIPGSVDTILVAMGACGNCWDGISWKGRLVIPRMDDCVTILLHTDDEWHANLKKPGHFYQIDEDGDYFSIAASYKKLTDKYGERKAKRICDMMYGNYTNIDIVDTGMFNCHDKTYIARNQRDADLIQVPLGFVEGSNYIIEKLITGDWNDQFIIIEQETVIKSALFL